MGDRETANRVLHELRVQSENVRRDPSEENYQRAEQAIERAGNSDEVPFIVMLLVVLLIVVVVIGVGTAIQNAVNPPYQPPRPPVGSFGGNIESVWVEHNVYQNSQKGMRIHLRFTTRNLRDIPCGAVAFFAYSNGTQLRDFNNSYRDGTGGVAVSTSFIPPYDNTSYSDFTLFMPYSELHMESGRYDLRFWVDLYDQATVHHFAGSESVYFTFTR